MKIKIRFQREALFYIGILLVGIVIIAIKQNYHVDEMFTYGLANSTGQSLHPEWKTAPYIYESPESAFKEYTAVQAGERFNFANVWDKQSADVHPPFYYVLVHIISSIFIDSCSKWIAGAINIAFLLLTFLMMRKILCLFECDEKEKDLISIFFIISTGMMNATSYLRMYVMAMFMVTLCAWWILRSVNEERSVKFYVSMAVLAVCGALTHYYFLLYLFFISLFFGLYLIINRKFLDAVKYIVAMLVAGGGSCLIFPAMLQHIFMGGYRGEESFEKLGGVLLPIGIRSRRFGNILTMIYLEDIY